MTPVFVDTSYYVALFNPDDRHHAEAIRLAEATERQLLVTEFVLLELGNALSRGHLRKLFTGVLAQLRADPNTTIVSASPELFERGCQLYGRRPDKGWSLTDCASFAVMADYGASEALTTDHHFRQAGFNVLLK